jgi:hypothetical protein
VAKVEFLRQATRQQTNTQAAKWHEDAKRQDDRVAVETQHKFQPRFQAG